jgi:hypothetical protein
MELYRNVNGDSGVYRFEIGLDYIDVEFVSRAVYRYSYRSAGSTNVEQMKLLARRGSGLGTFINKNVKDRYERRL